MLVVPFSGTVFLVTSGKQSLWGGLNASSKEMYKTKSKGGTDPTYRWLSF